jgi:hypothetical protein
MDIQKIYKETAIQIIKVGGNCQNFKCVLCPLLNDRLCTVFNNGVYIVKPTLSLQFAKEYLLTLPAEDVIEDIL